MNELRERSTLKLFFSYRRDDAAGWAGRLFDSLSAVFDTGNMFMDVDALPPGIVFQESIRHSIREADAVLVIIGRNWAGGVQKGNRRIDEPSDFVHLEITTALQHGKRVIPVLVDGARAPLPQDLPNDIAALAAHNAIELTHSRWKYDTTRLIDAILAVDEIGRLVASLERASRHRAIETVEQIHDAMQRADSGARQRTFELLKPVFCEGGTTANADTALHDRDVRRALWRCMRNLVDEPLERFFRRKELSNIDLYGLDFTGTQLSGVSLDGSFMVESDFSGSNLERASLQGCRIRNVDLTGARLNGADMTDADWFHAKGLTAEQLDVVRPGTLRPCPTTVNGMLESLSGDYAYPFKSWSGKVQQELRSTWKRYLEDVSFSPWRSV